MPCSQSLADVTDAEETLVDGGGDQLTYEQKLNNCNAVALPMATEKDCKKVYKLLKKASEKENELREARKSSKAKVKPALTCGIKAVQRALRKEEKGLCILAGDISPVDIYCHLPIVCEQNQISYIYVPSRYDIGGAMGLKRQCSVVLVHPHEDLIKYYAAVEDLMEKRFNTVDFQSITAA